MTAPLRKLMLECTTTYRHDYRTGIPRVVRNVIRHLRPLAAAHGYDVVPVHFASGGLYRAALTATGELATRPKGWRGHVRDVGRSGTECAFDGKLSRYASGYVWLWTTYGSFTRWPLSISCRFTSRM